MLLLSFGRACGCPRGGEVTAIGTVTSVISYAGAVRVIMGLSLESCPA